MDIPFKVSYLRIQFTEPRQPACSKMTGSLFGANQSMGVKLNGGIIIIMLKTTTRPRSFAFFDGPAAAAPQMLYRYVLVREKVFAAKGEWNDYDAGLHLSSLIRNSLKVRATGRLYCVWITCLR